jgi:AcrR family transcriptional regulator
MAERILEAAEEALRRYGPTKANVVDVARALGVSHGSVYRHFPSKAALRDAVTERWLSEISQPLEAVAAGRGLLPRACGAGSTASSRRSGARRSTTPSSSRPTSSSPPTPGTWSKSTSRHSSTSSHGSSRTVSRNANSPPRTHGRRRALPSTRRAASTIQRTRPSGATRRSTMPTRASVPSFCAGSRRRRAARRQTRTGLASGSRQRIDRTCPRDRS